MTHDHEHEHGHECEHGHVHSHEHEGESEHEAQCGGRRHEHENGHMHNHDHGHTHGRAHNHEHTDRFGISIAEHEGALVASLSFELAGGFAVAEQTLAAKLESLAAAVVRAGGIVGHIKAALTGDATIATLSTTGGAVSSAHGKSRTNKAEVVAIILMIPEQALRSALAAMLGTVKE
jgi:hypothetical protein